MGRYLPPVKEVFNIGDLVETVMGEYGIILGYGPHTIYYNDKSNYYKVLIDGDIFHYISNGLKKVEKKLDKQQKTCYTNLGVLKV